MTLLEVIEVPTPILAGGPVVAQAWVRDHGWPDAIVYASTDLPQAADRVLLPLRGPHNHPCPGWCTRDCPRSPDHQMFARVRPPLSHRSWWARWMDL